jgi:hypothetical protein
MSASSAVRASHDGAGTGASTLPASRRASATSSDGKAPVSAPDSADAAVAAAADGLVRGADGKPLHHLQQGVVHIPKNRLWIVMPGLMLTVYCA